MPPDILDTSILNYETTYSVLGMISNIYSSLKILYPTWGEWRIEGNSISVNRFDIDTDMIVTRTATFDDNLNITLSDNSNEYGAFYKAVKSLVDEIFQT